MLPASLAQLTFEMLFDQALVAGVLPPSLTQLTFGMSFQIGDRLQINVEELLGSLKEFAEYYCRIALGSEPNSALAEAFHDIRELRADVCYPMLMEVYQDFLLNKIMLEIAVSGYKQ